MQLLNLRTLIYTALTAFVCVGAMGTPAQAQPNGAAANTGEKSSIFPQQLQREARQLIMQLNEIKQKAIAGDKRLQAQRRQLAERVMKLMHEKGFKPEEERKQLVALKKSIQSGTLDKDVRAEKVKEFQTIRAQLVSQQREAIQDESLRQERQALNEATTVAMKKQDPKTEELLNRLAEINQKLQKLRQTSQ